MDEGSLDYDYLIVATGARHSYFGHDEWTPRRQASRASAMRWRSAAGCCRPSRWPSASRTRRRASAWLTFVIVGGGPTGVELAGALCEIAHHALAKDFRRIDPKQARIILLEGSNRVLTAYVPELSEKARRQLIALGVDVRTGAKVDQIDDGGVSLSDERVAARTVLWAAGVTGSRLGRSLGVPLDRANRVVVNPDLSIPGHAEVYVIGDLASLTQDGELVPGVAPAAMQEGRHAAKNILCSIRGTAPLPFRYHNKGSLATIGRKAAVAQLGRLKLSGVIAWLAWLLIHIMFLIGFRNRFLVVFQWAWSFLSYDRGARLITGPIRREPDGEPAKNVH